MEEVEAGRKLTLISVKSQLRMFCELYQQGHLSSVQFRAESMCLERPTRPKPFPECFPNVVFETVPLMFIRVNFGWPFLAAVL